MDETKAIILALTQQAISEWADGTKELMFPVTPETRETPGGMLWNMAVNAMAVSAGAIL